QVTNAVEVYDVLTDTWSVKSPMPIRNYLAAYATFNGRIYVLGGGDGSVALSSVYEYDPSSDSWRFLPPIQTARYEAVAGVANGKIYLMGGSAGSGALSSTEEGTPVPAGPSVTTNPASSVTNSSAMLGAY